MKGYISFSRRALIGHNREIEVILDFFAVRCFQRLSKKLFLLDWHGWSLSVIQIPERSDNLERSNNQIKINICTEEENVFEVLSGVDHRKKRTQIKPKKLNFDEHLHLVKRVRIEAEDETKIFGYMVALFSSFSFLHIYRKMKLRKMHFKRPVCCQKLTVAICLSSEELYCWSNLSCFLNFDITMQNSLFQSFGFILACNFLNNVVKCYEK